MERFPRLFLLSAIGYLLAGILLGLSMSVDLMNPATARFIHVHLNMLGFMAMFIYGVAYHILPRFNATPIKHPVLVKVHFYLVNAGLIGMVAGGAANGVYGSGAAHALFAASGGLEAMGIFVFAYNIVPVLMNVEWAMPAITAPQRSSAAPPSKSAAAASQSTPEVTADTKVAELIEKHQNVTDLLVASGLKTLAFPAARATFAKTTTLEQACRIHRIDLDSLLVKINSTVRGEAASPSVQKAAPAAKKGAELSSKGKKITRGETPGADTLVGSLIEAYPEAKPVFEKHYGEGCFTCPGQAFETVAQTANMHGIKADIILNDIIDSIKSVAPSAT